MKEKLITFETAKLAKEKGFDWFYYALYYTNDGKEWVGFSSNVADYDDKYVRCSQSLLQSWLRDEHNINIYCRIMSSEWGCYLEDVPSGVDITPRIVMLDEFKQYEDAMEFGLQEALKLI